jgi:hypothetical protein
MIDETGNARLVPPSGEVMLKRIGAAGEAVVAGLREAHESAIDVLLDLVRAGDEPDLEEIRSRWREQIEVLLVASVELDVIRVARLRLEARLRRVAEAEQ